LGTAIAMFLLAGYFPGNVLSHDCPGKRDSPPPAGGPEQRGYPGPPVHSPNTLKTHLKHLYAKTGTANRKELILLVIKHAAPAAAEAVVTRAEAAADLEVTSSTR